MPNIFFFISNVYPRFVNPFPIKKFSSGSWWLLLHCLLWLSCSHSTFHVQPTGFSVPHGAELFVSGVLHFQFSLSGATLFPGLHQPVLSLKVNSANAPLILLYFTYLLFINDLIFHDLKWSYLLIWLLSVPQQSFTGPRPHLLCLPLYL